MTPSSEPRGRRSAAAATIAPPADPAAPEETPEGGDAVRTRSAHAEGAPPQLPRLVLRFAIYTAIGLAFAAGAILLFVRSYVTSQAENSVKYHARFVAEIALGDKLHESDFDGPVTGERRAALDQLFASRVLLEGTLQAVLFAPNGTIAYATGDRRVGTVPGDAVEVRDALGGTSLRSRVSELDGAEATGSRRVLSVFVPVRFGRGDAVGVFALRQDYAPIARTAREAFIPIAGVLQVVLLALYVSLFPILRRVTNRLRRQLNEIEHQALHDGLTGLPNRRLFGDRIAQSLAWAKRTENDVAVMLIDLDRFKEINDTLGHQSGDALLQQLGERLRGLLRGTDTIARLGGDEFGVVLPVSASARGTVVDIVKRIRAAVEQPVPLQGIAVNVGASIGIAFFPDDGEDVETLTKRADVAMYVAKAAGTGYEFYETERDANDAGRLALASELRAALEAGEIVLHFQPKVDLSDGSTQCVEALARWQHAERGLMPPGDFIPLADEAGLIKPLTSYVLDAALRQCREWDDDGVAVRVAVNLDMRSLLDLHFVDEVEAALAKWNLAPDRLELEITEGTIMADPARVEEVTRLLSAMGVDLAIDDFGTGYSSLAYLRSLPIAEIKIDKSFVTGMGREGSAAAIVRGIVDLGRNLGLRVVAEGVETEEALKVLAELDCGFAQGFHLARPAPADELVEWLRNGARPVRSKRARRKKSGSGAATAVPGLAASSLRR